MTNEEKYFKALEEWKKEFDIVVNRLIKEGRALYYGVSKEDVYAYEDWSANNKDN
jgi:hypothetical protein